MKVKCSTTTTKSTKSTYTTTFFTLTQHLSRSITNSSMKFFKRMSDNKTAKNLTPEEIKNFVCRIYKQKYIGRRLI